MKIGEKVWVLCEVVSEPDGNGVHVTHRGAGWYADLSACKPVEPKATDSKKRNAIFTMQGHTRQGTYGVAKYYGGSWLFETVDGKFSRWCDSQDIELLEGENSELPVKQSLTGENKPASDSDYRAATPKDVSRVVCGEKVKARFRDHKSDEWTKTDEWLGGYDSTEESKWIDDTGCPWKYCQVYDPEKPQHEPDNPARHLPAWFGKGLRYLAAMSDATVVEVLNNQTKKGLNLLSDFDTVETGDLFQSSRDGKFHRCNFTVGMPVREAVLRGYKQRETWTFYRPKVRA